MKPIRTSRRRALTPEEIRERLVPGEQVRHLSSDTVESMVVQSLPNARGEVALEWILRSGRIHREVLHTSMITLALPKNLHKPWSRFEPRDDLSLEELRAILKPGMSIYHKADLRVEMIVAAPPYDSRIEVEYFVAESRKLHRNQISLSSIHHVLLPVEDEEPEP